MYSDMTFPNQSSPAIPRLYIGHSEDLLPEPEPSSLSQCPLPTPDLSSPTWTSAFCPRTFGLPDLTLGLISMTLRCLTSLCLGIISFRPGSSELHKSLSDHALSPTQLSDSTPGCPTVSLGSQPVGCHLAHSDSAPASGHPSQLPDHHLRVPLITPGHSNLIPRSPRMVAIVALQPTLCSLRHSSPASDIPSLSLLITLGSLHWPHPHLESLTGLSLGQCTPVPFVGHPFISSAS